VEYTGGASRAGNLGSRSFYFGFSLKLIFAVTVFLLIISKSKKLAKQVPVQFWFVSALFALSVISTLRAQDFNLAFLGFVRIASSVIIYISGTILFRDKKIRKYFRELTLAFLLFLGFIGTRQFITQQPIGLFLEDSLALRPFGYITPEGDFLNRVSGLTGHPTFFGSFLSLLFPIGIASSFVYIEKKQFKNVYFVVSVIASLLGLVSIFGTFSRSAWIALLVTTLFFVWRIYKVKKREVLKFITPMILPIVAMFVLFSPLFLSRIASFRYIWTLGSGRVRLDLIDQAWLMIKAFPLFGVGLNHFTRVMNLQNLPPELKGFMFPVHNTFLLFFAELGTLAGILFIVFVFWNLYQSFRKSLKSWVRFGIWVGAFTFLINAQFHTLFSQDPSFDLFIILLAYLSAL